MVAAQGSLVFVVAHSCCFYLLLQLLDIDFLLDYGPGRFNLLLFKLGNLLNFLDGWRLNGLILHGGRRVAALALLALLELELVHLGLLLLQDESCLLVACQQFFNVRVLRLHL